MIDNIAVNENRTCAIPYERRSNLWDKVALSWGLEHRLLIHVRVQDKGIPLTGRGGLSDWHWEWKWSATEVRQRIHFPVDFAVQVYKHLLSSTVKCRPTSGVLCSVWPACNFVILYNPVLHAEAEFRFPSGDQPSWLRYFVIFLVPSRQMLRQNLKSDRISFHILPICDTIQPTPNNWQSNYK